MYSVSLFTALSCLRNMQYSKLIFLFFILGWIHFVFCFFLSSDTFVLSIIIKSLHLFFVLGTYANTNH